MVKRRTPASTTTQKSTASPSSAPSVSANDEAEIGYTIGQWAGKEQYLCRECAFDTLELDVMLEHLLRVHSVIASTPIPPPFPHQEITDGEREPTEKADGLFEIDLKEDQDNG